MPRVAGGAGRPQWDVLLIDPCWALLAGRAASPVLQGEMLQEQGKAQGSEGISHGSPCLGGLLSGRWKSWNFGKARAVQSTELESPAHREWSWAETLPAAEADSAHAISLGSKLSLTSFPALVTPLLKISMLFGVFINTEVPLPLLYLGSLSNILAFYIRNYLRRKTLVFLEMLMEENHN